MGSTGSGRFGNYHGGNGDMPGGAGNGVGGGSGGTDGGAGEINCPAKIERIRLEDVATSEYYTNNNSLPASGDDVYLNTNIFRGRLVVNDITTGDIIGNLPTHYNYLITCLKKGMNYSGVVDLSGERPVPFVVVTLNA